MAAKIKNKFVNKFTNYKWFVLKPITIGFLLHPDLPEILARTDTVFKVVKAVSVPHNNFSTIMPRNQLCNIVTISAYS